MDMCCWIETHSALVMAAATVVLAIWTGVLCLVTYYYARATWRILECSRRSTEAVVDAACSQSAPQLVIVPRGGLNAAVHLASCQGSVGYVQCYLANAGAYHAVNVYTRMFVLNDDPEKDWHEFLKGTAPADWLHAVGRNGARAAVTHGDLTPDMRRDKGLKMTESEGPLLPAAPCCGRGVRLPTVPGLVRRRAACTIRGVPRVRALRGRLASSARPPFEADAGQGRAAERWVHPSEARAGHRRVAPPEQAYIGSTGGAIAMSPRMFLRPAPVSQRGVDDLLRAACALAGGEDDAERAGEGRVALFCVVVPHGEIASRQP